MEQFYSEAKVLTDLGLTVTGAKVYLTLTKYEVLDLATLAEMSKIARPDTYRTLKKLQEKGLVEKILEKPTKYRAIPKKEALTFLLEAKTRDFKTLKKETQYLIDKADIEKENIEELGKKPQFVLVPHGKRLVNTIRKNIERTQVSICNVLTWERFSQGVLNRFADSMEKACERNVEIRFIVENPPQNKTSKELIQFCKEKFHCQIKIIPNRPKSVFAIYDDKEILIITILKADFQSASALWSNSNALVALGREHFEELWRNAKNA